METILVLMKLLRDASIESASHSLAGPQILPRCCTTTTWSLHLSRFQSIVPLIIKVIDPMKRQCRIRERRRKLKIQRGNRLENQRNGKERHDHPHLLAGRSKECWNPVSAQAWDYGRRGRRWLQQHLNVLCSKSFLSSYKIPFLISEVNIGETNKVTEMKRQEEALFVWSLNEVHLPLPPSLTTLIPHVSSGWLNFFSGINFTATIWPSPSDNRPVWETLRTGCGESITKIEPMSTTRFFGMNIWYSLPCGESELDGKGLTPRLLGKIRTAICITEIPFLQFQHLHQRAWIYQETSPYTLFGYGENELVVNTVFNNGVWDSTDDGEKMSRWRSLTKEMVSLMWWHQSTHEQGPEINHKNRAETRRKT